MTHDQATILIATLQLATAIIEIFPKRLNLLGAKLGRHENSRKRR